MTRVLVVASSVIMRAGLDAVIATSPDLEVVGGVAGWSSVPQQIDALQPDVVLVEVNAQDDLTTLLSAIEADPPHPAVVILLEESQPNGLAEAVRLGVRGVLPTDAIATEITTALQAAATGLLTIHPDFAEALLTSLPSPRSLPEAPTQPLTPREIEVLQMLAEGLGNKAIARRLQISEHTVKFHISSLFTKLHASSRTEAVMLGARQGLVVL